MGIAWVVLAPIAIMAMRFGKRWNPFAFRVHQLLLMLVFLVTLGAFILAVVKGDRRDKKHLAVGCVVLALAVMQLLLAIFRPNKQSGKREVFYLLHSNGGRLCWLLALINVFIGLDIADASTSLKVVTGVVTGVFAVTFALLTLMGQKFPSKEAYIRRDDESADAP
jgi:Eukaryotic cytochrome b561